MVASKLRRWRSHCLAKSFRTNYVTDWHYQRQKALDIRYPGPPSLIPIQLARCIGLSVFEKSALLSPVEDTSSAPVSFRICFALLVQFESSQ